MTQGKLHQLSVNLSINESHNPLKFKLIKYSLGLPFIFGLALAYLLTGMKLSFVQ